LNLNPSAVKCGAYTTRNLRRGVIGLNTIKLLDVGLLGVSGVGSREMMYIMVWFGLQPWAVVI
jgi:hypothetical protein